MTDPISLTISVLALAVSTTTAWLTLLRRGTIKMTQPTVIFLGPDTMRDPTQHPIPKVYLRTLLFSTSKRGRVIENMYIALSKNETHQNFNIWVHGEHKLIRGSGLFVGETGVSANHHFLTPSDNYTYKFTEGEYKLEVFCHLLGDKKRKVLFSQKLIITKETANLLKQTGSGVYFDWGPDSGQYLAHVETRPPSASAENFLELIKTANSI